MTQSLLLLTTSLARAPLTQRVRSRRGHVPPLERARQVCHSQLCAREVRARDLGLDACRTLPRIVAIGCSRTLGRSVICSST